MSGDIDVSIIIVTYNSKAEIENCIKSIIKNTKRLSYEIIIVDNSSIDNTIDIIKMIEKNHKSISHYISDNKGFSHANNIGIRNSSGKYIALINPDTIFINDVLFTIITSFQNLKNPGACGACIFNEKLLPSESYNYFPSIKDSIFRLIGVRRQRSTFITKYKKEYKKVDCPIGACFIFNRSIIEDVGYMDEEFFLYFDDADYAFRMKEKGFCNYVIINAKLIHLQGKSTNNIKKSIMKIDLSSYIKFLKKHKSKLCIKIIINLYIFENYLKYIYFSINRNQSKRDFYKSNIRIIKDLFK